MHNSEREIDTFCFGFSLFMLKINKIAPINLQMHASCSEMLHALTPGHDTFLWLAALEQTVLH